MGDQLDRHLLRSPDRAEHDHDGNGGSVNGLAVGHVKNPRQRGKRGSAAAYHCQRQSPCCGANLPDFASGDFMVADQERICKTLGIKDAMRMIPERRTVRIAAEVIFPRFAVIVFHGSVRRTAAQSAHGDDRSCKLGRTKPLAWATWIAFAAMLLVGPWRQRRRLQFYASMATIMFCATLGAYSMPN
jgi:hypothetical protein